MVKVSAMATISSSSAKEDSTVKLTHITLAGASSLLAAGSRLPQPPASSEWARELEKEVAGFSEPNLRSDIQLVLPILFVVSESLGPATQKWREVPRV